MRGGWGRRTTDQSEIHRNVPERFVPHGNALGMLSVYQAPAERQTMLNDATQLAGLWTLGNGQGVAPDPRRLLVAP